MTDKLRLVHVARVFFLEFMRNRSEQVVQFGPDVFINPPFEQFEKPSATKIFFYLRSKE
jgi:hypothetical protein